MSGDFITGIKVGIGLCALLILFGIGIYSVWKLSDKDGGGK